MRCGLGSVGAYSGGCLALIGSLGWAGVTSPSGVVAFSCVGSAAVQVYVCAVQPGRSLGSRD